MIIEFSLVSIEISSLVIIGISPVRIGIGVVTIRVSSNKNRISLKSV